jgi:photosystem II stability/assembly factor-like uncharacterized protein
MKYFIFLLAIVCAAACERSGASFEETEKSPSKAGEALLFWNMSRSFPDGIIHTEKYTEALDALRTGVQERGGFAQPWEAIGPSNIGGRTLCIAIHPADTNILWAGSASGGLWKSTSAGIGPAAWQYVETGFPVLGVSAIAINPDKPDEMYIGTGEVYNLENSAPNVAIRTTRGTYGIGILKSTDGGRTWAKSLDWSYGDLRGVQDIKINPLRPATVYAATTEGLMRTYDAGASWKKVHDNPMAVDIEIIWADTNRVFVTCGSLDDNAISGIFSSTDGGKNFTKLTGGLPASYSGKAMITASNGQPGVLFASVGNAFQQEGLYRTANYGTTWQRVSTQNVAQYQGWYSHDVVVSDAFANTIIWVGIDTWKSLNNGFTVTKKSVWSAWYFGEVPAGGPEGPGNYVHADIHRVYFDDKDPKKLYLATDGGVFVSYNFGESFSGRNGGYQTQQFYANMGYSATNPKKAIGGMQDNSTAVYYGKTAWTRILGGDGQCAAIDPVNDSIMYGSSQYLRVYRTDTDWDNYQYIVPEAADGEDAAFNGPFELAPSDPSIIYMGAQRLYRSDNRGDDWAMITTDPIANGDVILTIAPHPANADLVWLSTAPSVSDTARVFKLNALDGIPQRIWGLPNRFCMDIAPHPTDENVAFAAFAGFGSRHIYKTTDGGITWQPSDTGLPDVPTNTLLIDPLQPDHIYAGNDLGVWVSTNGGTTWQLYSLQAPRSLLVMHLGISADRKLCAGTYGHGVWQTDMVFRPINTRAVPHIVTTFQVSPNPATDWIQLQYGLNRPAAPVFTVTDMYGRVLLENTTTFTPAGEHRHVFDVRMLPPGMYVVSLQVGGQQESQIVSIF